MVNSNPLVAQSVEQLPFKEMVVGSIPTERTTFRKILPTEDFSVVRGTVMFC